MLASFDFDYKKYEENKIEIKNRLAKLKVEENTLGEISNKTNWFEKVDTEVLKKICVVTNDYNDILVIEFQEREDLEYQFDDALKKLFILALSDTWSSEISISSVVNTFKIIENKEKEFNKSVMQFQESEIEESLIDLFGRSYYFRLRHGINIFSKLQTFYKDYINMTASWETYKDQQRIEGIIGQEVKRDIVTKKDLLHLISVMPNVQESIIPLLIFEGVSFSKIEEMRTQFISDVSHELKTPIALIQGYAEGLVENVNSEEENRQFYANVILDEANKMDKLVKQLLELMKLEYGKREFQNANFNITELIQEVIRKSKVMLEENNIEVRMDMPEEVIVFADEFYIEQVVTNYFTNAIKHAKEVFSEKYIKIKIEMRKKTNKVRVYVFNTGDNIEEENLQRIWRRFYKVDSSRNRDNGGTGIGLALVKAIMNNYNNDFGVQNKDTGVEFYFDLDIGK